MVSKFKGSRWGYRHQLKGSRGGIPAKAVSNKVLPLYEVSLLKHIGRLRKKGDFEPFTTSKIKDFFRKMAFPEEKLEKMAIDFEENHFNSVMCAGPSACADKKIQKVKKEVLPVAQKQAKERGTTRYSLSKQKIYKDSILLKKEIYQFLLDRINVIYGKKLNVYYDSGVKNLLFEAIDQKFSSDKNLREKLMRSGFYKKARHTPTVQRVINIFSDNMTVGAYKKCLENKIMYIDKRLKKVNSRV